MPRNRPAASDHRLRSALRSGRSLDGRTIRAATIRRLFTTCDLAEHAPKLEIVDARILGTLDLQHIRSDSALILRDCILTDAIDLSFARFGHLSLQGAHAPAFRGYALRVENDVDLTSIRMNRVDLFGARIGGRLWATHARLDGAGPDSSLNAPDIAIEGGMYCHDLRAASGVNLYGARIGAGLEFEGATINGTLLLFGAQVDGQLWLNEITLKPKPGDWAINAPLLAVHGGMYCRNGFHTSGGVNLFGARIGTTLEFRDATVGSSHSLALRAPGILVGQAVDFSGRLLADGAIDLSGARINGRLELHGLAKHDISVDMRSADIQVLVAAPMEWPSRIYLNGLVFGQLQPYLTAKARLEWLLRDPDGYQPQPYEQLALHYRGLGHDEEARTVLLGKQRRRRARLSVIPRIWGYVQDITVGYGYRPTRALGWFAVLCACGTTWFSIVPPRQGSLVGPHFQAFLYTLDLLLPVVDLRQERTYYTTGPGVWVAWALVLAGWTLVTAIVAGLSRVVARS